MSADLLAALAARDIRLFAEDGRLVLDAPTGAVTEADRAAIRAHRAELLTLLTPAEVGRPAATGCPRCGRPSPASGAWCDGCLAADWPMLRYPVTVRWAKERGWLRARDPFTGEWHELRSQDAPPSWLDDLRRRRN